MESMSLGLTAEVEYIPIDTSKVPYTFSVKLGDRTYTLTIKYNASGEFFTMDLAVMATGEILCFGEPIRYGRPMFSGIEDERYPQPVIIPYCLTGEADDVTLENLGKEVLLYLHERKVK